MHIFGRNYNITAPTRVGRVTQLYNNFPGFFFHIRKMPKRVRNGFVGVRRGGKRAKPGGAWVPTKAKAAYIGEVKFHDIDIDDSIISVGGTIQNGGSVNLIGQGVTENERIGRKCTITSINYRFNIKLPAATTANNTSDTVRILFYLDKQANGSSTTVTQILESDDFQSFRNLSNVGRFTILMDKTYEFSAGGMGEATGPILQSSEVQSNYTFYKKVNIVLEFNSTTGSIAEIRSNNLCVATWSESGLCVLNSKLRLRFHDG